MSEIKKCNVCGEKKALSLMVPSSAVKCGYRPLCWKCKVEQNKVWKANALLKKHDALKPVKSADKLNPTQIRSCGLGGYKGPRKREPNEALPPQISKMQGKYKPPVWAMRPGADDHRKYKSVGL